MPAPGHARYRITSLTRGLLLVIPSMKQPTEKPSKQIMRFFTPELYMQFNSPDDSVADEAQQTWDEATERYKRHIDAIREKLPAHVRKLTEICLHDAEVLGFEELREPVWPEPFGMAALSLKQESCIWSLFYFLRDRIQKNPPIDEWLFSKSREHWLYDEVDVSGDHDDVFLHRILFSDGTAMEIPFALAIVHPVPLPAVDESGTRRTA